MLKDFSVLGFDDYLKPASALAKELNIPYFTIMIHRFPDGESKVTIPAITTKNVILCRSLNTPNDKLVEIFLTASQLRQQGCEELVLVAPYLCYMRQDKAFSPGEIVSQQFIGAWLATLFDCIVTVDPHLHRIDNLDEIFPNTQSLCLSASQLIGDYIKRHFDNPFILGPDAESKQWVENVAVTGNFAWDIAHKQRHDDRHVSIQIPTPVFNCDSVVIVDDMISTGNTVMEAANLLRKSGVKNIACVVTHGLFSTDTINFLHQAGIYKIVTTDSITHTTNSIALSNLLAKSLTEFYL